MLEFAGELREEKGWTEFDASSTTFELVTATGVGPDEADVVEVELGAKGGTARLGGEAAIWGLAGFAGLGAADDSAAGVPFTDGLVAETGAGVAEAGGGTARLISSMSSSRPRVSGLKRYPVPVKGVSGFAHPAIATAYRCGWRPFCHRADPGISAVARLRMVTRKSLILRFVKLLTVYGMRKIIRASRVPPYIRRT